MGVTSGSGAVANISSNAAFDKRFRN